MWQTVLGTVVSDACKLRDEARGGERDLHSEMNHVCRAKAERMRRSVSGRES